MFCTESSVHTCKLQVLHASLSEPYLVENDNFNMREWEREKKIELFENAIESLHLLRWLILSFLCLACVVISVGRCCYHNAAVYSILFFEWNSITLL